MKLIRLISPVLLASLCGAAFATQQGVSNGEWPYHGGDIGHTRYSSLDQIDRENVGELRIAWRRPAVDPSLIELEPAITFSNSFRASPLMVDDVLYAPNAIGLVEAFDPGTGRTLWVQELPEEGESTFRGRDSRAVAFWEGGNGDRLFVIRNSWLTAIEAPTGRLVRSFGNGGRVDLRVGPGLESADSISSTTPLVIGNVVVTGSSMSDSPLDKSAPPGDVRAFDAVTGEPVWTFHVIPREGEPGVETWEDGSWAYSGHANVWALISADLDREIVYLATSSPTSDMYGGHRPGDNLYSDSIVAVGAATGEVLWHFQTVHHDLWDYDLPAAPILADITVEGREIPAVVVLTKSAFAFVFDRVTGEPVWPIEERPVPSSATPGERTARTQPFPTRPAPFDRQGISPRDLIDFTPQMRAEALEIIDDYLIGPLFTPPSVRTGGGTQGTLQLPGSVGGADWNGGALDPETGILYIPSVTGAFAADLVAGNPEATDLRYIRGVRSFVQGPQGLPLTKPPYGRITAIDLNTGEHVWMVPNGDGPRDHPAIADLDLPPLGQPGRASPLLTKTLLFVGEGDPINGRTPYLGGGRMFRAYDKATGEVVWEVELPAGTTGAPITYMHEGMQYIVIAVGSLGHTAEFIGLALP